MKPQPLQSVQAGRVFCGMTRVRLAAALLGLLTASSAAAADLVISVRDAAGRPLPDAVVAVRPAAGVKPGAPMRFPWPLVVSQKNIAFDPYLLIVPVGSEVSFPNKDTVRHHVYSFSATKRFELKLFGHDKTRHVTFDKAGVVALGCNIHDQMIGYVYVADTPFTVRTGANGEATVKGLPVGGATMTVWRADMRARVPQPQPINVAAGGGRTNVILQTRPGAAGDQVH